MAVAALPDPPEELLEIDPNTLTIGELEEIEEIVGRPVAGELGGRATPSMKTLLALVFVYKRRSDPSFTLDDARALRIDRVNVEGKNDPKGTGR